MEGGGGIIMAASLKRTCKFTESCLSVWSERRANNWMIDLICFRFDGWLIFSQPDTAAFIRLKLLQSQYLLLFWMLSTDWLSFAVLFGHTGHIWRWDCLQFIEKSTNRKQIRDTSWSKTSKTVLGSVYVVSAYCMYKPLVSVCLFLFGDSSYGIDFRFKQPLSSQPKGTWVPGVFLLLSPPTLAAIIYFRHFHLPTALSLAEGKARGRAPVYTLCLPWQHHQVIQASDEWRLTENPTNEKMTHRSNITNENVFRRCTSVRHVFNLQKQIVVSEKFIGCFRLQNQSKHYQEFGNLISILFGWIANNPFIKYGSWVRLRQT